MELEKRSTHPYARLDKDDVRDATSSSPSGLTADFTSAVRASTPPDHGLPLGDRVRYLLAHQTALSSHQTTRLSYEHGIAPVEPLTRAARIATAKGFAISTRPTQA